MSARTLLVVIVGLAAVIRDMGWRRISNWTSRGAVIAGLIVHLTQKGWSGALHSLFGAVIALASS
jgi:Flp pilus assembly protein protease CpaA